MTIALNGSETYRNHIVHEIFTIQGNCKTIGGINNSHKKTHQVKLLRGATKRKSPITNN